MDRTLAANRVRLAPLLQQALSLGTLAHGTIPLLSIVAIIGMPFGASGFSSIPSWDAVTEKDVFTDSQTPEVFRTDAASCPADMVYDMTLRDITDPSPIRYSVGSTVPASKPESSIPIPIRLARPEMASRVGCADVGLEAAKFLLIHSFHVGHGTPWAM